MNPIKQFSAWYFKEVQITKTRLPAACCLSTIGIDGFPNSRFLSLKEVKDESFIVTGSYSSRKATEISANDKVALAFWWPFTERQARVQGNAIKISRAEAENYFSDRNRESKIVSHISRQGNECINYDALSASYIQTEIMYAGNDIPCPDDWGGYKIIPQRIELLEFKASRFHQRQLWIRANGNWEHKLLQP